MEERSMQKKAESLLRTIQSPRKEAFVSQCSFLWRATHLEVALAMALKPRNALPQTHSRIIARRSKHCEKYHTEFTF